MRVLSVICLVLVLLGCNSTPYNDDYTKHHNSLNKIDKTTKFVFVLEGSRFVDLRGSYINDDSVNSSQILYAGDGGLIGMLLQVGIHSAAISSQRDSQLSQAQDAANAHVSVLRNKAKAINLDSLTGTYQSLFFTEMNSNRNKVYVKPIFFSNAKKTSLHMQMVAWIPTESKKVKKKPQFKYKNLIQVYSKTFNDRDAEKFLEEDSRFLQSQLSSLMQMGLYSLNNDITGIIDDKLKTKNPSSKTYVVGNESATVYRGKLVEQHCEFNIVKDLHSWLIAFPINAKEDSTQNRKREEYSAELCFI